jgi:HprK-related kinase A
MSLAPLTLRVGPMRYHIAELARSQRSVFVHLYGRYPQDSADAYADFTVGITPTSLLRRFVRQSLVCYGDVTDFDVAPMPVHAASLMLEMTLNMQVALLHDRHLVLHASAYARQGKAIISCADSGSGKSTLAALLGHLAGWRFLADEFVLLDPQTGLIAPFPRPISLKNQSIDLARSLGLGDELSPEIPETHKGRIAFLRAPLDAIAGMDDLAEPIALVFPQFDGQGAAKLIEVPRADAFTRLVFSAPNYRPLGAPAFHRFADMAARLPCYFMTYPDFAASQALIETVWERHGG